MTDYRESQKELDGMSKQSFYFQTITRYFLDNRGAPFFLSLREIDQIEIWEKMGIPLRVVLEGIKDSFLKKNGSKPRKRGWGFSLGFCNTQVQKAFQQYKDRKVGQQRSSVDFDKKRIKIAIEVERFLDLLPDPMVDLRPVFSRLQNSLSQKSFDEDLLESAEEEIEKIIPKKASGGELEKVKRDVLEEYGSQGNEEYDRIFRLKLVKHLRDKYKIPHISPYYY